MTRRIKFLLLCGLLTLALPALADMFTIPVPIEKLTSKADLILRGTVVSETVERDPEGRIYTKIDLLVSEVWKGSLATNHFTIVHGGGNLGEEQAIVSGQVQYEIGEEVVAFLLLNPRGQGVTIGLSQGKFHVFKDPATGEKLVHNPFHGQPESTPAASPESAQGASRSRLSLADLKQRVSGVGP